MRLTDALRLRPGMSVAFTGAGGKSSALETLAQESRGADPIVLTTTTRLGTAQRSFADEHVIVRSVEEARHFPILPGRPILVTGPEDDEESKLLGLQGDVLAEVARRCRAEGARLAIEADGARGRWVKAPADHEPVVPAWVDVVVPVAGMPAVGFPLSPATAHRPERIAGLLGMKEGDVLSARLLAALVLSHRGGLQGIPEGAEVRVLLTGADNVSLENIVEVRDRLLAAPRVRAVVTGELPSSDPVRGVDGRVAGIVLAAGAGERFGGPKQLARWKGRPLLSYALQAAREGGLSPIVVVLGARQDDVRSAVGEAVVVENPEWQDGQSTSVRAGLSAVEGQVEAAVFLLADMPRVNGATIRRLVAAHRVSLPAIVAPMGGGRRGNPVLFDRRVFPALHALSGDQGGRSLLERWPWQAVEADPYEFAEVDRPDDLAQLEQDP
ncbi:MAG: putative selenium-dependent hydroxylase accessory protein YqeC [Anaerolineales bacterium]|nr:putative selenium-dependent hydroxylase accessory protein YqeC [Anaerolineales bacterium]